ncbi:hypothetical protein D3C76_1489200 [compost metagenome]
MALLCRRLPLTSTSTWSEARPRNEAPWAMEPAKAPCGDCGKLNDGDSAVSAPDKSWAPVSCNCSALSTSTGAALSRAVTSLRRVPTTTTVSSLLSLAPGAWA